MKINTKKTAIAAVCAAFALAIPATLAGCSGAEAGAAIKTDPLAVTPPERYALSVCVNAPDADGTVPPKVDITGYNEEGVLEAIAYARLNANETFEVADVAAGTYTVECTTPVNEDGTVYAAVDAQIVTVEDSAPETVIFELEMLDPESAGAAQLAELAAFLEASGNAEAAANIAARAAQAPRETASTSAAVANDVRNNNGGSARHEHVWIPQTEQHWVPAVYETYIPTNYVLYKNGVRYMEFGDNLAALDAVTKAETFAAMDAGLPLPSWSWTNEDTPQARLVSPGYWTTVDAGYAICQTCGVRGYNIPSSAHRL